MPNGVLVFSSVLYASSRSSVVILPRRTRTSPMRSSFDVPWENRRMSPWSKKINFSESPEVIFKVPEWLLIASD